MMPAHKLKFCMKCETDKPPEGGVEMSSTRWICMGCWVRKFASPKKATNAYRSQ